MAISHKLSCHCEEQSDVAISLGFLFPFYQGIPTGLTALGMTANFANNNFPSQIKNPLSIGSPSIFAPGS